MWLSDQQVEFIRTSIDNSSINIQEVKDDLLDHFCCSIENQIQQGVSFEAAYEKTFLQVCPNGLNQIQNELFLLVNLNKILIMNKLKYSLGFMASLGISIGSLFKLMHWPGADHLLVLGLVGFVMLFLPMLAYEKYKGSTQRKAETLKDLLGFASVAVLGIGAIFMIGHLTGAGIIIVGGAALFTFGFLPLLFLGMYRNALKQKLQ